jgi:pyrroline-5-carboxylate reductase
MEHGMHKRQSVQTAADAGYTPFIDRTMSIIGVGNMGSALLKGILNVSLTPTEKITACDIHHSRLSATGESWKVKTTTNVHEAAGASEIILLCVKPQTLGEVIDVMRDNLRPDQLVISIAAGVTIQWIQQRIGKELPIVRSMPNIAATVDQGATALSFGKYVEEEHQRIAISIFEAVGEVAIVAEEQLDAVTGLSGSGPAYVYMFIESLIDGGVKMGLPRDVATALAIQTVLGSAALVKKTGQHPAVLRDQVSTPAGTAINAIHKLESHGFRSIIIDAVVKAANRSKEISELVNAR